MTPNIPNPEPERASYSLNELVRISGLSRSSLCRAIKENKLRAVKLGVRVLIPQESFREFLFNLPKAS